MATIAALDMSYQVSLCANCQFVYASELPDNQSYSHYYQKLSKYDVMTATSEIRPADQLRMTTAVNLCAPHLATNALIADIGCGTGTLLHSFKQAGWKQLYGIDPAPEAATKAASLFGLNNVCTGTLDNAAELLPLDQAELVCLTGVLEHLPNLRKDLSSLIEKINANAKILIEVPSLERFLREPLEPYGEFSLEHIQYFSAQSLGNLMSELGYIYQTCHIEKLSTGITDSLFGLFMRKNHQTNQISHETIDPRKYIEISEKKMQKILNKLINHPAKELVIYGAGSHSARLLPRMTAAGIASRIIGIVDSNPNLRGQYIGEYTVQVPTELQRWPNATVVISSFSSEQLIANLISQHFSNPILRLYS